jgi:hypothetical protein
MTFFEFEHSRHPAKRERPHCIAKLFVHKAEWTDMQAICAAKCSTQIIDVTKVPIIPAFEVHVLCSDPNTARALTMAWLEYCESSPHRPHGKDEALAWGEQYIPFPYISRDWTF